MLASLVCDESSGHDDRCDSGDGHGHDHGNSMVVMDHTDGGQRED